jgi:hypothetical protein
MGLFICSLILAQYYIKDPIIDRGDRSLVDYVNSLSKAAGWSCERTKNSKTIFKIFYNFILNKVFFKTRTLIII